MANLRWFNDSFPNVAVRLGKSDGVKGYRKYGYNPVLSSREDPETIWPGNGLYPWQDQPYQAQVRAAVAPSAPMRVRFLGLAGDEALEVAETVEVDGTDPVLSTRTDWCRIDRAVVLTPEGNVGDVFIETTEGVPQVIIPAGTAQSAQAALTIPGDRQAAIMSWEASLVKGNNTVDAVLGLFTRVPGGPWRRRSVVGLLGGASTVVDVQLRNPIALPPKSDVEVRCVEVNQRDGVAIQSTFEVLAIETESLV